MRTSAEQTEHLTDAVIRALWQQVRGPYAQLDGPLIRFAHAVAATVVWDPPERDVIVRADSYLSLLWHRHTPRNIKDDAELRVEVERTIDDLRRASSAHARRTPPAGPEGCDCDQKGNPDMACHASDCAAVVKAKGE